MGSSMRLNLAKIHMNIIFLSCNIQILLSADSDNQEYPPGTYNASDSSLDNLEDTGTKAYNKNQKPKTAPRKSDLPPVKRKSRVDIIRRLNPGFKNAQKNNGNKRSKQAESETSDSDPSYNP